MTEEQLNQLLAAVEQRVDKAVEPFKGLPAEIATLKTQHEELKKTLAESGGNDNGNETGNTGTEGGTTGTEGGTGGTTTDNTTPAPTTEGGTANAGGGDTAKASDEDALKEALSKALDKIAELEERTSKKPTRKSVSGSELTSETVAKSDNEFLNHMIKKAASGERISLGVK